MYHKTIVIGMQCKYKNSSTVFFFCIKGGVAHNATNAPPLGKGVSLQIKDYPAKVADSFVLTGT